MPQQCAEPPPRPPPTGAKQGHNPPTTPPPQPDSPGKPPKPHPPNPTHPRGSSPHTRGARVEGPARAFRTRIIPAYAGSTSFIPPVATRVPDHPRIRGEHAGEGFDRRCLLGSSPHTRGAPRLLGRSPDKRRIIPAYAGSTPTSRTPAIRHSDHPRIRGEHPATTFNTETNRGSSPHTRGALHLMGLDGEGYGIIPAYAGSTQAFGYPQATQKDHPRIRGEHTWKSLQYQGSPP